VGKPARTRAFRNPVLFDPLVIGRRHRIFPILSILANVKNP